MDIRNRSCFWIRKKSKNPLSVRSTGQSQSWCNAAVCTSTALIFTYDDGIEMPEFLVMTSGNTSGAPICRDDQEAEAELSGFCDCMLSHDRKIRIRADDSVMDFYEDRPYMIRRSRGYAPLPFMVSTPYRGRCLPLVENSRILFALVWITDFIRLHMSEIWKICER